MTDADAGLTGGAFVIGVNHAIMHGHDLGALGCCPRDPWGGVGGVCGVAVDR